MGPAVAGQARGKLWIPTGDEFLEESTCRRWLPGASPAERQRAERAKDAPFSWANVARSRGDPESKLVQPTKQQYISPKFIAPGTVAGTGLFRDLDPSARPRNLLLACQAAGRSMYPDICATLASGQRSLRSTAVSRIVSAAVSNTRVCLATSATLIRLASSPHTPDPLPD
jgi:hypothetical protein